MVQAVAVLPVIVKVRAHPGQRMWTW